MLNSRVNPSVCLVLSDRVYHASQRIDMTDDTIIIELSSSRVPEKVITKDNKSPLRGIRIGQYRPDIVRVSHVGKNVELNESLHEFVYALRSVMAVGVDLSRLEETIRVMKFVNSIGSNNG